MASVTSAVGLVAVLKNWGLGGSVIVLCLGFIIALSALMVLVGVGLLLRLFTRCCNLYRTLFTRVILYLSASVVYVVTKLIPPLGVRATLGAGGAGDERGERRVEPGVQRRATLRERRLARKAETHGVD